MEFSDGDLRCGDVDGGSGSSDRCSSDPQVTVRLAVSGGGGSSSSSILWSSVIVGGGGIDVG